MASSFKQINDEPIAISYTLIKQILYESPVFYEDTVKNGRKATYRIRSVDIFGRMSEYSDPITFKGNPPNSPSIDSPVRSDAPDPRLQSGSPGRKSNKRIVLPIHKFTDTVDLPYTVVAAGARPFEADIG